MSDFSQRDLEDLSEELKAFTEGMRRFTGKFFKKDEGSSADPATPTTPTPPNPANRIASEFDKSTQKIVNALATLSVNLTKASATEREKKQHFDEFNIAVKKSTRIQQQSYDAAAATVAAAKQAAAAAAAVAERLRLEGIANAERAALDARRNSSMLWDSMFDNIEQLKAFNTESLKEKISANRGYDNAGKAMFNS